MDSRSEAWLRISMTPGLGPKGYALFQKHLLDAELRIERFFELPRLQQKELWDAAANENGTLVTPPRRILPLFDAIPAKDAVAEIATALKQSECGWVGCEDSTYPRRLIGDLTSAPPVLFYLGNLALLDQSPTVGIVGCTGPSRTGSRCATTLGHALGEAGWLVVSGLAKGIDQAGHRGALDSGGATAAFLPQGILTFDMPMHLRKFAHRENFIILSTWAPLTPWGGVFAVRRDAFIAETSDALVAVEMSARGGGTKHTVDFARERQRPVWTLKHRCVPHQAQGNPWLIKTGARPLHLNEKNEVEEDSLQELISELKRELAKGKKRRKAMQLEMF